MPTQPTCPRCGAPIPPDAPAGVCPRCVGAMNFDVETEWTGGEASAKVPPLTPEELAPHFPQLEIIRLLGRGGMGVVYLARQKTLNRLVALKLLAPERVHDSQFAQRFTREAQALAALSHPNIVTVYDFGQAGGFFYLLMEYVDGVNLRQAIRGGRFTPEQALAIVPPICEALQFAHDRGIVHRDIKPENLLLDREGRAKIADFGVAKLIGSTGEHAATDQSARSVSAAGTPHYMAPEERSQPSRADHRADIYSLGVVLYELLTGELPGEKLKPPSTKVRIDVRLDEVVLRALETKPELRYATAAEFKTKLENIVHGPTPSPPPLPKERKSKRMIVALTVVLFFVGAGLGFVGMNASGIRAPDAFFTMIFILVVVAPLAAWGITTLTTNSRRPLLATVGLKSFGCIGLLATMPLVGLSLFFVLAFINERGHWNPNPIEACVVSLTWLGALVLPVASGMLLKRRLPSAGPGWGFRRWLKVASVVLAVITVAAVLFVIRMNHNEAQREAALERYQLEVGGNDASLPPAKERRTEMSAGIGIALASEEESIVVQRVFPETAATGAMREGDIVLSIAQEDGRPMEVTGQKLRRVVDMIRGPPHTVVYVTWLRPDEASKSFKGSNRLTRSTAAALLATNAPGLRSLRFLRGDSDPSEAWGDGQLLAPGTLAPDLSLISLADDQPRSLQQFRGRVVVLQFWANWSVPSHHSMEALQSIMNDLLGNFSEHPSWAGRVAVVTASADQHPAAARVAIQKHRWVFPESSDAVFNAWVTLSGLRDYHVPALPVVYIIDQEGRVAACGFRFEVEEQIEKALKTERNSPRG